VEQLRLRGYAMLDSWLPRDAVEAARAAALELHAKGTPRFIA
jgi:hypothetical protein